MPTGPDATTPEARPMIWTAGDGATWHIELHPDRLLLHSGSQTIELPVDAWRRDLYVAPHGNGFIVRVETFERSVGFIISREQAEPLLIALERNARPSAPSQDASSDDAPVAHDEMLWPKVSPLAVWALMTSAAVFLPFVGIAAAVATTVLLVLHRGRVRRVVAYRHSRVLCTVACVFMVAGLIVSVIGAWGIVQGLRTVESRRVRPPAHLDIDQATSDEWRASTGDALAGWPRSSGPGGRDDEHDRRTRHRLPHLQRRWATRPDQATSDEWRASTGDALAGWPRSSGPGGRDDEHDRRTRHRLPHLQRRWATQPAPTGGALDTRAHPAPTVLASFLGGDHNWGLIAAGLFVVLFSLTVHEAAHAISAWWLGDDLARRLGRVTLNPLAHIDPFGTVVLPLVLFLAKVGVFGWAKPVPVRVENLERPRRAHILISIAGPGSNLIMAAVSLMLIIGLVTPLQRLVPGVAIENLTSPNFQSTVSVSGVALAPLLGPLLTILQLSFIVNVFLAFFNLIPLPPLDGSWVLEHLFPRTLGPIYERIRPFSFLLFLGLLYGNVLVYLLVPAIIVLGIGFELTALCAGL